MGLTTSDCANDNKTPRDLLANQLRIYTWRADPNLSLHVPRVSFLNAQTYKQEKAFAEFLRLQQASDYLQLEQFRREVMDQQADRQQQILVFEKHFCVLTQLAGFISLEESIYLLHVLLMGFEEIRRVYEKIVVQSSCCFVTAEGIVKVWINPNPKCNQLWTGLHGQLVPEGIQPVIIQQIVDLAERLSGKSSKIANFFILLRKIMHQIILRNGSFAQMRCFLNEYSYKNNVQASRNLAKALEKMRNATETKTIRKSNKRQTRNTEPSQCLDSDFIGSNQQRYSTAENTGKGVLNKCRSVQTHVLQQNIRSGFVQSKREEKQQKQSHLGLCSSVLPTVSLIVPASKGQHPKFAQNAYRYSTGINDLRPPQPFSKTKASTHFGSELNKATSGILKNKMTEVTSIKENIPIPEDNRQSKDISSENPFINVNLPTKGKQNQRCPRDSDGKKPMQASIIQYVTTAKKPHKTDFVRTQTHHKTQNQRFSIDSVNESNYSRPWITTKTITKLINDNSNPGSIKNSLGSSSDCYNGSIYSGALTNLGRDIAVLSGNSKVMRVSRQQ